MPELVRPTMAVRDSFLAGERAASAADGTPSQWLDRAEADFAAFVAASREDREMWGVPMTELWYVSGDAYLGALAIRHRLTPELRREGGHIGYNVVPEHRRQGHATAILGGALILCRPLGLTKALVTCDDSNVGSRRVIEANGGVLEQVADDRTCRYWISVKLAPARQVTGTIGGLVRILLGSGPMSEDVNGHYMGPLLLGSLDFVWSRIRERLNGLTTEEYLWEPAPSCWSVRLSPDGGWQVERPATEPSPPPVTTIAWRLWHIGSECLAAYTSQGLGPWPLEVSDREWYATPEPAIKALDEAWLAFRAGLAELGEDGLWQPLGPQWEEFADDPWAGLVLHAQDEMSHHGAEISLLRDLYAVRR